MRPYSIYTWQEAPLLRLLIPFMGGIAAQWYAAMPLITGWTLLLFCATALVLFNLRFSYWQFRFKWVNGVLVQAMFFALGALLCWYRYPANGINHLSKYYHAGDAVTVTIEEPLSEKTKSFKAMATVEYLSNAREAQAVSGAIIIYFQKDSSVKQLGYGDRLIFNKPLQAIQNTGAYGGFDYERYAAFQGIYQQVYLKRAEFVVLPGKQESRWKKWLLHTQLMVTGILKRYIPGQQEAGLAEALLIGYKDDLDKSLLQSYTNTGVVHIIAISGLHVGLIYWLLDMLLAPLATRKLRRIKALVIIAGLWLFALLAGGSPSVLRSALMFSCMVAGEQFFMRTSVYNTLAVSAFILLCIDPFWCWDPGFQLSYSAVLSIVIFMRPIYGLLFFQNKLLDLIWKLNAVTLAAQMLTLPLCLYHFHQFPVYFLITNLVAVPLSTLIVLGEIILCALSPVPVAARLIGIAVQGCLRGMNGFIGHMENMPLALMTGLEVTTLQLLLLYVVVAGIACWLLRKDKTALLAGLCGLLGLAISRAFLW